jgi:DNA-binding response OmpR family regulator
MLSVLVVDDEPALLEAMREYFSRVGNVSARTARTAHEGLSILATNKFDAIVLDYDMPEIDGIAFLKSLRSKGDTTPVIIFTGVGGEHAAIESLNNGADFFIKKGEHPDQEMHTILDRIYQVVDGRIAWRSSGTAQSILTSTLNFSSDPSFAIDRDGKVIAWNGAMEQLTGIPVSSMLKKGSLAYAEPFFGKKQRMLIDLVFEKDDDIQKNRYLLISREKDGPVIGVTKGVKSDGSPWTLWMKAMPFYDSRGNFIASVASVKDITATVRDVPLPDEISVPDEKTAISSPASGVEAESGTAKSGGGLLDRILGRAISHYKDGVLLYGREGKYRDAIAAFDKALEIDTTLSFVWNDRGICYRELGEFEEALKSFLRAVELAPDDLEVLYDMGETLEKIGIQQKDAKYLDAALQTFHMVAEKSVNNASAWNHIGVCLMEMGRAEESKVYFDRARDVRIWKKDTPITRKRDEYLT